MWGYTALSVRGVIPRSTNNLTLVLICSQLSLPPASSIKVNLSWPHISCPGLRVASIYSPVLPHLPVEWVLGNRSGSQPAERCRHTHPSWGHPAGGSAEVLDPTCDLCGNAPTPEERARILTQWSHVSHQETELHAHTHTTTQHASLCTLWSGSL